MRTRFEGAVSGNALSESDNEIEVPPDSKVGSKVQDEVQKNVILLIILILVSIPLLDASTWFQSKSVYDNSMQELIYVAKNMPSQYQTRADAYIKNALEFNNPLLYFEVSTGSITDVFPDNYASYSNTMNNILN